MNTLWTKELLRNAEGEGGGGAGGSSPEGAQPSPDKLDALDARLNKLTTMVEGQSNQRKQNEALQAIKSRDDQLLQAKADAEANVTLAEQALAAAYDDGDGMAIAKAQRKLSESVAKVERSDADLTAFRNQVKQAEADARNRKPQAEELDETNLTAWKGKNSEWYGVDAEMTKASHEIDRQIRGAGVLSVGSKEYFDAIDRQMAQRFPDRMGGTPPTGGGYKGTPAPQPRSRGTIQQSIADGWRRMGIDVSNPETLDRMLKNREKAVQKGILSETPVAGPVITR